MIGLLLTFMFLGLLLACVLGGFAYLAAAIFSRLFPSAPQGVLVHVPAAVLPLLLVGWFVTDVIIEVVGDTGPLLNGPDVQAITGGMVIAAIMLLVGWPLGIFSARRATKSRKT